MARSKSANSLTLVAEIAEGVPWGWAALLAVLCAGAWRDAALLMRYPIAVGVDGYYYVLQVDALWSQHRLFFPSAHPLVLYVLAGMRYVTGDTVAAIKVSGIALHLALCAGIFALVKAVTRSLWLGVLGGALAAASSLHLYFIVEFINNLGAVAFLTWGCWAAIQFSQTRGRVYAFVAVACTAAAAFSHRSALPVALVLAGLVFLSHRLEQSENFNRRRRLIILLVAASWLVPAVFSVLAVAKLPVWLQSELSPVPRWPWGRHSFAEAIILSIAAPTALALLNRQERESRRICFHVLGAMAVLTLTFTLNPFIKSAEVWGGIAERLRGLSYVQAAVLVPGVLRMAAVGRHKLVPYLLAPLLPLIALSNTAPLPPGLQPEYIRHREQMIGRLREYSPQINSSSFVIAPHGDQFVVTAVTGAPAQQRMPDHAGYQAVYWLLRGAKCDGSGLRVLVLSAEGGELCTVLVEDQELRGKSHLLSDTDKWHLLAANPHIRNVPGLIN
jgi:hypothetical protein